MANPTPKYPEHRRNTSKPAHGEWVDIFVPELSEPAHPPLKSFSRKHDKGWVGKFEAEDFKRWDIWRVDPAAAYWSAADVSFAIETLLCYHEPVIGFTKEGDIVYGTPNWAEISRRLDKLGLTPKGKRDLRYRICFAPARDKTLDVGDEKEITEGVVKLDERRKRLQQGA